MSAIARPGSLLTSIYLYVGASVFWLSAAIATLFAIPQYRRHYGDLAQDADAGSIAVLLLLLLAGVAVLGVAVAAVLTLLTGHGWSGARSLTWVYSGLAALVAGTLVLSDPFSAVRWHRWLMTGTAVLTVLMLAGGAVLLARPASGRFFRDHRAARQNRVARRRAAAYHQQPQRYGPAYPPRPYPPAPPTPPIAPPQRPE